MTQQLSLTDEQEEILAIKDTSFRVLAAAGSGKTTTMTLYVKGRVEAGISEKDIMFITFTRFAAKQIKDKVKKIMGGCSRIFFGTFHSVIFKILYKTPYVQVDNENLFSQRFDEYLKLFMQLLRDRKEGIVQQLESMKILIVDEFQDLDEVQFEFLSLMKGLIPTLQIIAIGDLAQNIYRFRGTSNEFLRTLLARDICPDLLTLRLTTNFRSTPSILKFVNALFAPEIADGHILPMNAPDGVKEGIKPDYFEFAKNPEAGKGDYEDSVSDTLYGILKSAKNKGHSVCIIFPKIKGSSYEYITALLRDKLVGDEFPFDLHKIAKEDETCTTVEFNYDHLEKHPVQASTFHSSKGLEWDYVCVVNVSDSMCLPMGDEEESEAFHMEKTNLLYVALTRAAKRLYIFGNANDGGRHRHITRLWDKLHEVCNVVIWGKESKEYEFGQRKAIGVVDLIRRLPQHRDLYKRIMKCCENIPAENQEGSSFPLPEIYQQMKLRNRELALGTFLDWKLKQEICTGESRALQDIFLELISMVDSFKWFHKDDVREDNEILLAKLHIFFLNMEVDHKRSLKAYLGAARWIAKHNGGVWRLVKNLRDHWRDVERKILRAMKKEKKNLRDEYIISQAASFFVRGLVGEIDAVTQPIGSYQGLPDGFDDFVEGLITPAVVIMKKLLQEVGLADAPVLGDVHVESASLIVGEADMVVMNELLIEIKCGGAKSAADLRDIGNCKHLLQVLAYVTLGRHGVLPMPVKKACLVNPMTGAWEIYDIDKWSLEDSSEFMVCLEKLKERV